jgi:hypothetical protein
MNDDPGDLFIVLGSLFLIWACGYIAVHIIIWFWPWLLLIGGIIALLWIVLAFAQAWADDNQEWRRLEREWDEHIDMEREQIARRRDALESDYRLTEDEL